MSLTPNCEVLSVNYTKPTLTVTTPPNSFPSAIKLSSQFSYLYISILPNNDYTITIDYYQDKQGRFLVSTTTIAGTASVEPVLKFKKEVITRYIKVTLTLTPNPGPAFTFPIHFLSYLGN